MTVAVVKEESELTIKEYVPSNVYDITTNNTPSPPTITTSNDTSYNDSIMSTNNNKDEEMTTTTTTPSHDNTAESKPYSCPECHQTFSRPHNLKSHLTTHSAERPYRCDVCNHHFRRHHDLKRHQKLHTGERPYVCKNCFRSFARLDALNRHCRAEGGSACALVMQQQMKQQEQEMARIQYEAYQHENKKRRSEHHDPVVDKTTTMTITPPTDISPPLPPSNGSSQSPPNRPVIPQLQIPHPASHLFPKDPNHNYTTIPPNTTKSPSAHQLLPSPNVILPNNLTPPVYTSQKGLPITPSSPPASSQHLQHPNNTNTNNGKSPLYSTSPWSSPYSPRPTLPPLPQNHDIERLLKENEELKKDIDQLRAMAQKEATCLKSKIHDLQVENKVLRSLIHGPTPTLSDKS